MLPMFHIYSLVVVTHVSLFNCTPIVTLNRFTLKDFLESIQRWKITCLCESRELSGKGSPDVLGRLELMKYPQTSSLRLSSKWSRTNRRAITTSAL